MFSLIFCIFLGGLTAVIYTDTLQTFIILIGATVLMVVGKSAL